MLLCIDESLGLLSTFEVLPFGHNSQIKTTSGEVFPDRLMCICTDFSKQNIFLQLQWVSLDSQCFWSWMSPVLLYYFRTAYCDTHTLRSCLGEIFLMQDSYLVLLLCSVSSWCTNCEMKLSSTSVPHPAILHQTKRNLPSFYHIDASECSAREEVDSEPDSSEIYIVLHCLRYSICSSNQLEQ